MKPEATLPQTDRLVLVGVAGAIVVQVVLLVIAGWQNRHMLNPDGTAYIQLAHHYAKGDIDLAVTGYWGPMLSWLMVPTLGLVQEPLDSARIVMGLSGLVFLLGSVSVFRCLQIHPAGIIFGTWIAALASIYWSVENITPDLLMGGIMSFAISRMVSPIWIESRGVQLTTGMLYGAAYLAKAVALPVAFAMSVGIGSLWVISRLCDLKIVLKGLAITFLGIMLVASSWIVALSLKYGSVTISTSAKINHALVGPVDVERVQNGHGFHTPAPGRMSLGEDPSELAYKYWSPFESPKYFAHQLQLIFHNAGKIVDFISGFDRLHFGLIAALCGLLVHRPWRENIAGERWRWSGLAIVCISAVYLPVYAGDQRYYFAVYPFLISASIGMVVSLTRTTQGRVNLPRLIGICLVTLSFLNGPSIHLASALRGLENRSVVYTYDLAKKLQHQGIYGAIAGVGDCDRSWALYVAFFMNQPFYGCEANPITDRIKNSRAKLILVHRSPPLTKELDKYFFLETLDTHLFNSAEEAANFPVKAYRMKVT